MAHQPLSQRVRSIRQEVSRALAAGVSWRSVIDALRPSTSATWRGMSADEQSRFLRHLRPWWDMHRHRMAPPVGETIRALVDSGYLTVSAGRISGIETDHDSAMVDWVARRGRPQRLVAQRVIVATGPASASRAGHNLLYELLESGEVRLDRHGLGIDVDDDFRVIGRDGQRSANLWAIGPIVRGAFWECSAAPDIRRDAEKLAIIVRRELDDASSTES